MSKGSGRYLSSSGDFTNTRKLINTDRLDFSSRREQKTERKICKEPSQMPDVKMLESKQSILPPKIRETKHNAHILVHFLKRLKKIKIWNQCIWVWSSITVVAMCLRQIYAKA